MFLVFWRAYLFIVLLLVSVCSCMSVPWQCSRSCQSRAAHESCFLLSFQSLLKRARLSCCALVWGINKCWGSGGAKLNWEKSLFFFRTVERATFNCFNIQINIITKRKSWWVYLSISALKILIHRYISLTKYFLLPQKSLFISFFLLLFEQIASRKLQ